MDTTTPSPHNGVAQFLRHFAPRRDDSSFLSPGRRSYVSSSKQRTRRTYSNVPTPHNDLVSPTSVVLPHFVCESKATTSTNATAGGMRLGISPTSYDIPGTLPSPLLISPKTEEEVVVFESEGDSRFFPTLFDSLSTWEEATKLELENVEPPSSPQKSVANSCGSHCSNSSGSVKSIRSTTMRIFGSRKSTDSMENTKRKAKEIVNRSREKADSGGSGGWRRSLSPATTKSNDSSSSVGTNASESSRVKIFFLLLEPTTKVFELIQLVYPRKSTKVEDLLKMIPNNATEPALANQAYIGITRPKRRSDPVLDLNLWASNNLFSTTDQTAGITHGEVIVAIPAYTSASLIVSLAKQILASGHIQTLISKSSSESGSRSRNSSASPQRSQDADQVRASGPSRSLKKSASASPASPGRSKEHRRTHSNVHTPSLVVDAIRTSDGSKSSHKSPRRGKDRRIHELSAGSNHSCSSTQTGTSQSSITPVSPEKPIASKSAARFQTFSTNQAVEVEHPAPPNLVDAFYYGYGSTSNKPFHKPLCVDRHAKKTPFLSENVFNGYSSVTQRMHEVEFSGDMLNAYLSKDAVKNICEIVGDDFKPSTKTERSPTSITDDMSLDDGSLTSSFQHWSQSLRDDTMWMESDQGLACGVLPSMWTGKKQFTKHFSSFLFRLGVFAFVLSLARYYNDPAGMTNFESRHNVHDTAFGVFGLVQFISCFLVIVKLQRIVLSPVTGRPSKCHVMLLIAHMYESRYGRPVGQTCEY